MKTPPQGDTLCRQGRLGTSSARLYPCSIASTARVPVPLRRVETVARALQSANFIARTFILGMYSVPSE